MVWSSEQVGNLFFDVRRSLLNKIFSLAFPLDICQQESTFNCLKVMIKEEQDKAKASVNTYFEIVTEILIALVKFKILNKWVPRSTLSKFMFNMLSCRGLESLFPAGVPIV